MAREYDVIIRGGLVVDGSGGEPFTADVAISGSRIAAIGEVPGFGREEIDAQGLIVTPGFVDIHTHYDGQVTWEDTLSPSSAHGVTTVVMGNCGVGFAPVRAGDQHLLVQLMEGVEDIPEVVMAEGVPWNWQSFPDYLDALDRRHTDIDFAAQLPHSPLRVYVMGQRGADLEPATADDLAAMRRLTREAIDAGALGVSTSRLLAHRFRDGRPIPTANSAMQELEALAGGLQDAGGGVFQLVLNNENSSSAEWQAIEALHEASGRPVHFSLMVGNLVKGGAQAYLDGLDRCARDGRPIRGQFFPRPVGTLMGLDLSFHPFSLNPSYRPIAELPLDEKLARVRDPALRAALLAEQPADSNAFYLWLIEQTHLLFALGNPPNYNPAPEDSIKARAARMGVDERALIYDELLRDGGKSILYCPLGNNDGVRFDLSTDLFGWPNTILGLGDGGAHYGMICDAAYTTFVLGEYVVAKPRLSIAEAVHMLSQVPAAAVGLCDRGLLRPGYKADINVIALDRLQLHAPRVARDLPAGGRRLQQRADGYAATLVSGRIIHRDGHATGERPGRLVRGARSAA